MYITKVCSVNAAESESEFTESDDEFQIWEMCNSETKREELLQCSCCKQIKHPACFVPPEEGAVSADWTCVPCNKYLRDVDWYNKAAERMSQILRDVHSLDLPNNPLDEIIYKLGGPDKVAEITGRHRRVIKASDGNVKYEPRNRKGVPMEMVNMNEKQSFMDGSKLIAIISEAASAGVSLQADRRASNQRRRVHVTLELPWGADRAIQQFGRTHRSNQTSAPEYRLLFSNLGGERRFASTVAKRLESLGALTQGDRRSAGPSLSAYNYDSVYGKRALENFYHKIVKQSSLPVAPPGCSLQKPERIQDLVVKGKAALESVGIVKDNTYVGHEDRDIHDVRRFLNRLLGIQPEMQNSLFELYLSEIDLLVEQARVEGHFDSGIANMKANTIRIKGQPKKVHIDHLSKASTVLFTLTLDRGFTWEAALTLLTEKRKDKSPASSIGFYKTKRESLGRRNCLLAFEGSSRKYRIFRPAIGEAVREMPLAELEAKYEKFSSLEDAHACWDDEYMLSFKQCLHGPRCKHGDYCTIGRRLQEVNVLSGLILPVWATVQKILAKQNREIDRRLRIVRVETTTDSRRIVGLLIPSAVVNSLLEELPFQDIDE